MSYEIKKTLKAKTIIYYPYLKIAYFGSCYVKIGPVANIAKHYLIYAIIVII